jgi:hypothetical protein
MSTIYKGFDYNDSTTAAPWGARETIWNKAMIDTLVTDTVQNAYDASGHGHMSVYNVDGVMVLDGESSSHVELNGGSNATVSLTMGPSADALLVSTGNSGSITIGTSGTNSSITLSAAGTATDINLISTSTVDINTPQINVNNTVSSNQRIEFGADSNTYIVYDGDDLKIKSSRDLIFDNFNTSSMLICNASGVVQQGPLLTDGASYAEMPANVPLQFSSVNTSIYGGTAGSGETLAIGTAGTDHHITITATGSSNTIELTASGANTSINLASDANMALTAGANSNSTITLRAGTTTPGGEGVIYLYGSMQGSVGFGCNGQPPQTASVIGTAATDAGTTLTRVNLIADALIANGIAKTA